MRYLALALSGVLAGLGGVHMSMGYLQFFQRDMTSGRGFIALATPYLGGGHPVGTGLASLVFGFFDALSTRVGSLEIPSQLPQMLPYMATVLALVIYALQAQLAVRVRTLRSAEGTGFDAAFWKAIRRLSVLHMFMAMLAVFGVIVAISMFSAPNGFKGPDTAFPLGAIIGGVSLLLIVLNLPFMLRVERIGERVVQAAAVAVFSLWVYLGILFYLMLYPTSLQDSALPVGFGIGLAAAAAIWLALGGYYLLTGHRQHKPQPA